ncbi:ABC transporter permease [Rahnella inusitata]|uniref:ABC transporter permease n=1 Tax=Rahnella inusitata TaxID=58169 RepID=UPI0039B0D559
MTSQAAFRLVNVNRTFISGDMPVHVLKNISLEIKRGEMVAIVGPSGSGKSSLMNLLGCLDQPSSGEIHVAGVETTKACSNQLAALRSQHIGFIFQRYHLMPYLSAQDNVAVPARYTSMTKDEQRERSSNLLTRLGLAEKMLHRPSQLSGGQQQRVSIARALMNGADIILADEPTGALDAERGKELMTILHSLHQAGQTIILVTHDPLIASQAERIIEIKEGQIVGDRVANPVNCVRQSLPHLHVATTTGRPQRLQSLQDSISMAWQALHGHRVRTLLSMLGMIIGVVSVIVSMAVGNGAKQKILHDISDLGVKSLSIHPGLSWSDLRPDFAFSLSARDVDLLQHQTFTQNVSPVVNTSVSALANDQNVFLELHGVDQDYFAIHRMALVMGRHFTPDDLAERSTGLVVDSQTAKSLFPDNSHPVGEMVQLSGVPFVVIGVMDVNGVQASRGGLQGWIPYTTLQDRLEGQVALNLIELQVKDGLALNSAQQQVEHLLDIAHGRRDFFIQTDDTMVSAVKKTSDSLTLLVATIAGISLIVGGIGVMNIMLVSVTERTHEIGIRLAVGAREQDILRQFLVESVVICLLGSMIGILLAILAGSAFALFTNRFTLLFTLLPILFSCCFSALMGLGFGFFPARNAAHLNPTEALARE